MPGRRVRGQPGTLLKLNEHLQANGVSAIAFADAGWQATRTLMTFATDCSTTPTTGWTGAPKTPSARMRSRSDLLQRMQAQFEFLPPPSRYIPWFVSPGFPAWAIDTAVACLDEFFLRLETPPFHNHVRHRIKVRVSPRVPCKTWACSEKSNGPAIEPSPP